MNTMVAVRWAAYWLALVFIPMGISAAVVGHGVNAGVCLSVGLVSGGMALVLFGAERGWWK